MSNNKSNESRRKLLKSIAAGSGAIVAGKSLPDSWSRPVVDSVLLPVHAQTSNSIFSSNNLTSVSLDQPSDNMFAGLMSRLVPEAQAQVQEVLPPEGCAMIVGDNVDFWVQFYPGSIAPVVVSGVIPLSGSGFSTQVPVCDEVTSSEPLTTKIVAATAAYIDIDFLNGDTVFRFPAAGTCVSKTPPSCI